MKLWIVKIAKWFGEWRIPNGVYCYRFTSKRGIDEETGLPWMGTKHCHYYSHREYNGVIVPYCNYLDQGSVPNRLTDEEWDKLTDLFGSEEATYDALPLSLLWDSCKECGINEEYDEN